jgi:SAM-dependent methyltransferase
MSRGRRFLFAGWVLAAVLLVLDALRLRRRARALPVVAPADGPAAPPDAGEGWTWLRAPGVGLDGPGRRAVEARAAAEGLEVVDVVPPDLRTTEALRLLREVDPATARTAPLAPGTGAFQATAVRPGTLARAGLGPDEGADPVRFLRAAVRLKRYAPRDSAAVVLTTARAAPEDPDRRLGLLQARFGPALPLALVAPALGWGGLALGLALVPGAGAAALAAYAAAPALALAGTPLAPPDLGARCALRLPLALADLARTLAGRWRPEPDPERPDPEALRPAYQADLAGGVARFVGPELDTCPVCHAPGPVPVLVTGDLYQNKPGRFRLTRCPSCGTVFQNPRLTVEGLDFYYRDFYDGLGEEHFEWLFGATTATYEARAALLEGTSPGRWLDVGAGHGHFCLVAQGVLPGTEFEGLDQADSIEEAERRGWVSTGHRGFLPDLAPSLAGRFDVVSMHHYLEHTLDPGAELDAAVTVLADGGHLLIELPDPEYRLGRVLGPYWIPWFQPQHLHLLPLATLEKELADRDFEVVTVQRGAPHAPADLSGALWLLASRLAPRVGDPWGPPPTTAARARRVAVMTAVSPVLPLAFAVDNVVGAVLRAGDRPSNSFRLLARRRPAAAPGD